jgi:tetratricopeptide (TPR) repeat protein
MMMLPVVLVACSKAPLETPSEQDAQLEASSATELNGPIVAGLDVQEPELLAYLQSMQQAVRDDLGSAQARGQLGMAYAANDFHAAAAASFGQAFLREPQDMRWPYYQAIALSEISDTQGALERLEAAIAIDAGYAPAWLLRGSWSLELDRPEIAEDSYRQAKELAGDLVTESAATVGMARTLLRQGHGDQAAQLLENLGEEFNHPFVAQLLGDAYRRLGRLDDMRRIAQPDRAGQLNWPDELRSAQMNFVRGFSGRMFIAKQLLGENRLKDATAILETLRRTHPRDRDLLNNLSIAYRRMGRPDDSFEVLQYGLAVYPSFHALHFNIAVHYEDRGDQQRALEHLNRAIELDPGAVEAHQAKVNLLMRMQNLEEALAAVEEFVRFGQADPTVLFSAGMVAGALEKWPLAIERFQQALVLDPKHHRAQIFLGRSLTGAARYDEARTVLDRAEESGANPSDVQAARRHLEILERGG